MAALLATPAPRAAIAVGKVLALSAVGLLIALSSVVGVLGGLALISDEFSLGYYGPADFAALLAVTAFATVFIVSVLALISGLARTTKEAQLYCTPLMVVVAAVGLLGMVGEGPQAEWFWYLIPLYGTEQCLIAILSFQADTASLVACLCSNALVSAFLCRLLGRVLDNDTLMFSA